MAVTHPHNKAQLSKTELLKEAREAEEKENLEKAVTLYKEVLKADPRNETAYNRLAIIFRKQKEWKKEWQIVKKAIAAFEDMYASANPVKPNRKISHLSNSFLKVAGLTDRKGKPLYQPGPLARWKKRKATLEKKLEKAT